MEQVVKIVDIVVYLIVAFLGIYSVYLKYMSNRAQADKVVAVRQIDERAAATTEVFKQFQHIVELVKEREACTEKKYTEKCVELAAELAARNIAERKLFEAELLIKSLQKEKEKT